jgi:3D (Asp-Asp-Asp) domain-containing protein
VRTLPNLLTSGPHKVGFASASLCYGPALVRALRTRFSPRSAAFSALAAIGVLAAVSGATAAGPSSLQSIAAQKRAAILDLYSLETRVASAQQRLAALQSRASALRAQQQRLQQQLGATRRTLAVSQLQLADNLRSLYKQGDVSTLAVVLGAQSLDDAVSQIDTLNAVADQSQQVVSATTRAQRRLAALRASLTQRRARIDAAVTAASHTLDDLASARAERVAFVVHLRTAERLKKAQIAALEARVQLAQQKSATLTAQVDHSSSDAASAAPTTGTTTTDAAASAPAPAAPAPAPTPAPRGRTLTVSSTGYSLPGHTATGLPVGYGVVAVDPSVIPLGTRMTIPGYGEGIAADTGSAVRGNDIDLWFPSLSQARAWGRRTVTITLH